jgi:hypothetical protein
LVTKNSQNAILKSGLLKVVKKKCGEKIFKINNNNNNNNNDK